MKKNKIVHNMKFILIKKSRNNELPEGILGLHLPYYDSFPEYNLFESLKKSNAIYSYNWYLDFSSNESKMIIDGFPHDLNNNKTILHNLIQKLFEI